MWPVLSLVPDVAGVYASGASRAGLPVEVEDQVHRALEGKRMERERAHRRGREFPTLLTSVHNAKVG